MIIQCSIFSGRKLMKTYTVSALLEGYRIEEQVTAVSIHHAIKLIQNKYSNARNVYVLN